MCKISHIYYKNIILIIIFSKIMTYVAIPEPSCYFAIRVGVHSTKDPHIIKGIHFVDGQNDNTYMELNPTSSNGPYNYVYGFYNYNKSIFHLFKFDSTYWSDGNIFISNLPRCIPSKVTRDKGSLGVISVYFYKAERLPEKRISSKKYSNKNQNMELTNSFDDLNFDPSDIIFINNPQEELCLNLKTTHSDPIAVLHIYYQTKEWIENYYKSKASPVSKSLDNNSYIKTKKTKVINEDFTIDDLLYGELTDVESESEYSSSSDSKNKQIDNSIVYEKEKVMMTNNFNIKKKKIIASSNESNNGSKNLVIENKDKHNYIKEIHIADNNNFKTNNKSFKKNCNIDVKVNRNFDKNKNKNINEEDQINNNSKSKAKVYKNTHSKIKNSMENKIINKNYYNNINNSIMEIKANSRNLQIESSINISADMEIENSKNLNIETRIKNICLNNIINKTLITENNPKEQNIIIIDNDNDNSEMISDGNELMFISRAEFEKKKIKEIIDLTID